MQESRERLQLLIDHAPASLAMFDAGMRYLAASRRWRDDYSLGDRDLLGRSHYEIFPEIPEHWKAVHRRGLSGEVVRADQERFERADGTAQWLRWEVRPWKTGEGAVGGIVIFSEDITARKNAEDELRLKGVLLDSVLDSVMVTDLDHRLLYVNEASWKSRGYTRDELLSMTIEELDTPEYAALIDSRMAEMQATSSAIFESAHRCKDGSVMPVEVSAKLASINERQLVIATVRDATKRRLAEERIRELSQVVEQSPESIVITDVDANIQYVNNAFEKATGYTRDDAVGKNPRILNSGRTPPETFHSLWSALRSGLVWSGELYNRRKDGSEYIELAIISPMRDANGNVSHYVAIKEDITEKKKMAAELEAHRHHLEDLVIQRTEELQAAKLQAEAANIAKSAFLANMSHEIRTPMNAIVALSHLLNRSELTDEQRERLGKINAATHHLMSIINDILDLSKIEAGRMELETLDFPVAEILEHARSMIADAAAAKGLVLQVELRDLPAFLSGDPTRLRQALLNYASNAVKFTDRGHVVLRAFLESESDAGLLVRFEVEDSGIGVPPHRADKLFAAFEQADNSTTRRYGGTGLGLAITRRIAELMDGDAGVVSVPGKGSRFWFTARLQRGMGTSLPTSAGPVVDAAAELGRTRSGVRILLAEDNAVNREVAVDLLRSVGLDVDVAVDGLEAVDRLRQRAYDLVLMDVQMPALDGFDATRAIRAIPGRRDTPILAMTANAFEEDRKACLAAGMNDFVAKPVDPDRLYETLLRWLPLRPYESEVASAEAVPQGDALQTRLGAMERLDLAHGLKVSRGQIEKYARLLWLFLDAHAADSGRLREAVAARDLEAVRRIAHGLKGAGGTIGAHELRRLAEDAFAACRNGDPQAPALASALADALASFVGELRGALGNGSDTLT